MVLPEYERDRLGQHTLLLKFDKTAGVKGRLTGNTKTEFKVLVVVGKVVFLHFTHVLRELGVVQRVVHAIVKNVWLRISIY